MGIIKRLVIAEWFKAFFSSAGVLFFLILIANLIAGFLRDNVTPTEVLLNEIITIPASLTKVLPVSCLIASLFSINKLKNRNELTAIFAAGFPRYKFILTIFQVSLCVAALQLFVSGYLEPFAKKNRHVLIEEPQKFGNLESKGLRASTIGSGKIWYKSDNYYVSFSAYNVGKKLLRNISIYSVDPGTYLLQNLLHANLAYYDQNDGWLFQDGVLLTSLHSEDFPSREEFKEISFPLNETPDDFKKIESDITTLNILGLYQYISKLQKSGININEYLIILLDKFSSSLICIVFALIAAVGIFTPSRRNSSFGKNISFVFVFIIFYWLIYSYFYELGKNSSINPYLACFSVPLLFAVLLTLFFYKNRVLR